MKQDTKGMWCLKVYATGAIVCAFIAHLPTGEAKASETLSLSDAQFCQGGLEVIYPEIDISDCMIIPPGLRQRISKEWGPPKVRMANAKKGKYVLMMLDPDAPSRSSPTRASWRHWLVVDIKGSELRTGTIIGSVLSEYKRPTPPQHSGLHRYQFMLFKQPDDQTLSLSKKEIVSLGELLSEVRICRGGALSLQLLGAEGPMGQFLS
ncbi:hypothetical protein AALO_G00061870 [Alosa alosa]|uniref:Phosphatidylethanolamine-binding protein 4 n=2 Tax=Alosa alosa TaxID=278164 RepID=A0AAV6H3C8_9TELE|nr:phosphatidylethanolamine-binding protein 4 isoform X1 [Alosa alosa]KAG5280592.1 hypothetical protein AALO_G00061870 [Alosa alosa]